MADQAAPAGPKLPVKPIQQLLSEDDRVQLENVIAKLPVIQDILHRAAQSGIDVSAHQDRHDMHKVIAQSMHTSWFPKELPAIQE